MTKKASTALRARIRGEGAEAAFEALLRVCRDPKASSQALASAGNAIFRAAGLWKESEDDRDLQPHEMTAEQLQARIEALRRRGELDPGEEEDDLTPGDESVFD